MHPRSRRQDNKKNRSVKVMATAKAMTEAKMDNARSVARTILLLLQWLLINSCCYPLSLSSRGLYCISFSGRFEKTSSSGPFSTETRSIFDTAQLNSIGSMLHRRLFLGGFVQMLQLSLSNFYLPLSRDQLLIRSIH